jgi:autophagy-related protein 2
MTLINAKPTSLVPFIHSTFAFTVDIPSVHIDLSKPTLDGLQYWADDAAQLIERTFGGHTETEEAESRDTSLIGSRFFAKSRHSGSEIRLNAGPSQGYSETVVKIAISEGLFPNNLGR